MTKYQSEIIESLEGFCKIRQQGINCITAVFYNPKTKETRSLCVRDYDYNDGSRDIDYLYNMAIDENALKQWKHDNGIICVGDTVKVVRGRKIPIGTVAKVVGIRPCFDGYRRIVATYLCFDNGMSTNENNCIIND